MESPAYLKPTTPGALHQILDSSAASTTTRIIAQHLSTDQITVQELKKQLQQDKALAVKQQALLEQQIEMLSLQLKESKQREQKQKEMHDSVMNAFSSGTFVGEAPLDREAERQRIRDEIVETEITAQHPKVKDFIATATTDLLQ